MELPRQVSSSVDVWSLGCVLTEAATWLVYGEKGLNDFRKTRKAEISNDPNHQDLWAFHDGNGKVCRVMRPH